METRGAGLFPAVPPGLRGRVSGLPTVETVGYFRPSLRDEEETVSVIAMGVCDRNCVLMRRREKITKFEVLTRTPVTGNFIHFGR